jgi:hypothetical protein
LGAALVGADLENADPGDFGGLDASDVGLQAALTVLADDISDVAEATGAADGLEVPAAPGTPGILRRASRPLRPAARTRRSSSSVTMTTIFPPRELRSVTIMSLGKKILPDSSYYLDNYNCR